MKALVMPKRLTPEEKIELLEKEQAATQAAAKKKLDQIKAKLQNEKAKVATAARKEDTHIKIVNGALSFTFFEHHPELAKRYREWISNSSEPEATKEKILSRLSEQELLREL